MTNETLRKRWQGLIVSISRSVYERGEDLRECLKKILQRRSILHRYCSKRFNSQRELLSAIVFHSLGQVKAR